MPLGGSGGGQGRMGRCRALPTRTTHRRRSLVVMTGTGGHGCLASPTPQLPTGDWRSCRTPCCVLPRLPPCCTSSYLAHTAEKMGIGKHDAAARRGNWKVPATHEQASLASLPPLPIVSFISVWGSLRTSLT